LWVVRTGTGWPGWSRIWSRRTRKEFSPPQYHHKVELRGRRNTRKKRILWPTDHPDGYDFLLPCLEMIKLHAGPHFVFFEATSSLNSWINCVHFFGCKTLRAR
jgi:hypothetical protein